MVESSEVTFKAELFDFQINGFGGIDFQQDGLTLSQFEIALLTLRNHKVAGIFATLISDEIDSLCRRFERLESLAARSTQFGSMICGYHLEGPWLSPEPGFHGAHPSEVMRPPSLSDFERLQAAANGRIKLVTLAPEWEGSTEFIAEIASRGISLAIGHSDASESQIDEAISAGLRFCTHLGNGVPQSMHRHDNILQRLLARDELTACFIPDGIHLPPNVLKNYVRAKPADKVLFTTDAMAGAGAGPGRYAIGRLAIEVGADGVARQPGGQGFAGSTLTPDRGVTLAAKFTGLSLAVSRQIWSSQAAEAFGIELPAANEID